MSTHTATAKTPPDRLLKLSDVLPRMSVGRSTLYRMIDRGEFPPPRKFGAAARWRESEVQAVIAGEWRSE